MLRNLQSTTDGNGEKNVYRGFNETRYACCDRLGPGRLRRTGASQTISSERRRNANRFDLRSGRKSEVVSGRIVRLANHVRLSLRKIDIGLDGGAVSRFENSNGCGAPAPNRSGKREMAARKTRLQLRRGDPSRS